MDSPEYKTLIECYHSLVTGIQLSPNEIADQPGVAKVLAQKDRQYVRNPNHEDSEKARRILDSVVNQVKIDPHVYYSFRLALIATGAWTRATVDKLDSTHSTLTKSSPGTTSVAKNDCLDKRYGPGMYEYIM